MNDRERIQLHRKQLREEFGGLLDEISAILFDVDPMNLSHGCPTDEYEPEAGAVLVQLQGCASVEDARKRIHQVFIRYFSVGMAGDEVRYQQAAERTWAAWQRYRQS
jgi:hypothetical protein